MHFGRLHFCISFLELGCMFLVATAFQKLTHTERNAPTFSASTFCNTSPEPRVGEALTYGASYRDLDHALTGKVMRILEEPQEERSKPEELPTDPESPVELARKKAKIYTDGDRVRLEHFDPESLPFKLVWGNYQKLMDLFALDDSECTSVLLAACGPTPEGQPYWSRFNLPPVYASQIGKTSAAEDDEHEVPLPDTQHEPAQAEREPAQPMMVPHNPGFKDSHEVALRSLLGFKDSYEVALQRSLALENIRILQERVQKLEEEVAELRGAQRCCGTCSCDGRAAFAQRSRVA